MLQPSYLTMSLREWAGEDRRQIALVMTDIIGSTALASKHGDDYWVDNYLIEHFQRARHVRDAFQGYEIKLIGDAFMAAFKTADQAFNFGHQFLVNPGPDDIFIRVAIHTGRVRIVENDIYGLMANFTARLIGAVDPHAGRVRSRIIVSDAAHGEIIAAYGDGMRPDFEPVLADLRSFGKKRAHLYRNRDVMLEVVKRRNRLNAKSTSIPSVPGATQEHIDRLTRQPKPSEERPFPSELKRRPTLIRSSDVKKSGENN